VNDRVKTASLALLFVLAILLFGGKVLFALLVAAAAALGAREYASLVGDGESSLEGLFVPLWAGAIVLGFLSSSPQVPGGLLALGSLVYLAAWIAGPGPTPHTLRRWGGVLGAWVLVAYFLGHLVQVRSYGISPVLFLAGVIWIGDTAAYYGGTRFGRRLLAPAVSPKKTVEGTVASALVSAALAFGLGLVLPLPHSALGCVAVGLVLNVAAQLGDLAESLVKRCAGVKDSGDLFPGHGGMLDRADAFLLASPLYALFLNG
jgi:phosphatidate cytidylyltransferase